MPHPERASEAILGSDDGLLIFKSLVSALGQRRPVAEPVAAAA
jgi:hypothetical protein